MPSQSDFIHLHAAATTLTNILRCERISHIFIGGYATGLLGGGEGRVTEVPCSSDFGCLKEDS